MTITTATPATTATGLSRDDLAALRGADSLSFHHVRAGDRPGGHQIVAYLHSYGERIYTAREQRLFPEPHGVGRARTIMVESSVRGYNSGRYAGSSWSTADGGTPWVRAFANLFSIDRAARTMLGLLRAGDVLALAWTADNNNQNHEGVGFHQDELELHASGPQGRDLWFRVASQVGPDNTARMVRRNG